MRYIPLNELDSAHIDAALKEFDRVLDSRAENTPWIAIHFDEDPSEVQAKLEAIARCKAKVARAREILATYPLAVSTQPHRFKKTSAFFADYDYQTTPKSEREDLQP